MVSVLRRKVDLATGLAPRVRAMHALWSAIEADISSWIESAFDAAPEVRLFMLKSVLKKAVGIPDESRVHITPQLSGFGLIKSISFDRTLAAQYAAQRMKQEKDQLEEVPAIFLKLINEDWANALCFQIELNLTNLLGATDDALNSRDNAFETGADKKVLLADFECALEDLQVDISIILDLEALSDLIDRSKNSIEDESVFLSRSEILKSSVRMSPITLEGILGQKRLSVGECSRLNAGDIIALDQADRENITVRVHTLNGKSSVAVGEMGAWKSQRAIRLVSGISEKFIRDLVRE